MKLIVTKDGSKTIYEVIALKIVNGAIEFDYINRFRTSPEDDVDLKGSMSISLSDVTTLVQFVLD